MAEVDLLICFAVKEEAAFFVPSARAQPLVRIVVTGMGRTNAERRFRESIERARPTAVISSGFAGGLRPELRTGTVLFETEPGTTLEKPLIAAGAVRGRFHCVDRVASTAAEKRDLATATGADAVEMESKWILGLARAEGVPAATVRVVLDTAEDDLPLDFNLLMNEAQELDPRKLALALLKRPARVAGLLRLRRQTQAAARQLGEVLRRAADVVVERLKAKG